MSTGLKGSLAKFVSDHRGAAVIEFALVLPILLALIMGIVTYGAWFMTAHTIQQAANDGARATLSGINATERAQIANRVVVASLRRSAMLRSELATVTVDDDGTNVAVRISYDGSSNPAFTTPLLPMPDVVIRRSAAVRLEAM